LSFLVHPLPPQHVYVRKEYLYDLEEGHGEYTPGIWISVKSTQYKALYFETLLTEYGALYDKLPLSAFVWKRPHGDLPLDDPEHKSFNIIQLDNGQFAAQPNNRVIWKDASLTPADLKQPDFKVCTQNYRVETEPKWSVGHTDEWQYKTLDGK
jgi:hypothetical protein